LSNKQKLLAIVLVVDKVISFKTILVSVRAITTLFPVESSVILILSALIILLIDPLVHLYSLCPLLTLEVVT